MKKKLKIFYTTDTHGYIFPLSYATNKKENIGLLGMKSVFKKDGNTLIIDGGDTIQGSPLAMYIGRQHLNNDEIHPIASVLNILGYDYVTLGNHDFNYGQNYLKNYIESLSAKVICANVEGLPILKSTIHQLENGLRVGIVGGVTDWVNIWENPNHLTGLVVSDAMTAIKKELTELKLKNSLDFTICINHGGYERNINTDEIQSNSRENIAWEICRELDFDLLLTGHQHIPVEGQYVHGTFTVQAAQNAVHFIEIDAIYNEDKAWEFKSSFNEPVSDINSVLNVQSAGFEKLIQYEKETQLWLDKPVGTLDQELIASEKVDMALNGSDIANFFNQIQLWATDADISATSLGNVVKGFDPDVSIRDIVSTYVYSNTLSVILLTGKQVSLMLERPAGYLELDNNGVPQVSRRFLEPKVEHYNYDFYANLTFDVDLAQPVGMRVKNIRVKNELLDENKTYKIVMNNYRSTGAGGYEILKQGKLIQQDATEISELIIKYIEQHQFVTVKKYDAPNWIHQ